MKRRLLIALIALTVLPLAALTWLGVRLDRQEAAKVDQQFDDLARRRLEDVDAVIARFIGDRERVFLDLTADFPIESDDIRERMRGASSARHALVIDARGKLVFPPPLGPVSDAERAFRERTRRIWEGRALGPEAPDDDQGEVEPAAIPSDRDHGWSAWYWADGLNLVFWRRLGDRRVIGVEVDRVRMLADVIGLLPGTAPDGPAERSVLRDASGRAVYQWGTFNPPATAEPRVRRSLSRPLAAWNLEWYSSGPSGAVLRSSVVFELTTGLLAVGLALVGLAIWFYRESDRDLREAGQRVTFVNQVSHELKTPLTNIRMYAELLESSLDDALEAAAWAEPEDDASLATAADRPRKHLGVIVSESQRLSRLISNILTFARDQRKVLRLDLRPATVDAVVGEAVDGYRPSLEARGIGAEVRGGAPAPVRIDGDAVEQILGNLLSNVEKYAAAGKSVVIEIAADAGRTFITVTDDGPGIPRGHWARVFRPFYRISSKLSDGVTGTGIGLSIARQLARLHGGDLVLQPSDRGARFRLELATPPVDEESRESDEPSEKPFEKRGAPA